MLAFAMKSRGGRCVGGGHAARLACTGRATLAFARRVEPLVGPVQADRKDSRPVAAKGSAPEEEIAGSNVLDDRHCGVFEGADRQSAPGSPGFPHLSSAYSRFNAMMFPSARGNLFRGLVLLGARCATKPSLRA